MHQSRRSLDCRQTRVVEDGAGPSPGQRVVEDDLTRIRDGGWALPRRSWAERLTAARRLPQDLAKRAARQCARLYSTYVKCLLAGLAI